MSKQQRGSSLLEVMVSMLLSSVAALALSLTTTVGYTLVRETEKRAVAHQLALNKIERLKLTDPYSLTAIGHSEVVSEGGYHFYMETAFDTTSVSADWWFVTLTVYPSTPNGNVIDGEPALSTLRTALVPWKKR